MPSYVTGSHHYLAFIYHTYFLFVFIVCYCWRSWERLLTFNINWCVFHWMDLFWFDKDYESDNITEKNSQHKTGETFLWNCYTTQASPLRCRDSADMKVQSTKKKCGNLVGDISACVFLYLGITMHSDVAGTNYYFQIDIFNHAWWLNDYQNCLMSRPTLVGHEKSR